MPVSSRFVLPAGDYDLAVRMRDTARVEGFDYEMQERIALTPDQMGGFTLGRDIRKMCTHMTNKRNNGTATCMKTMSVKKRLLSVPVEMKLRAIGSPKIGNQSISSDVVIATNCANLSHTSQ